VTAHTLNYQPKAPRKRFRIPFQVLKWALIVALLGGAAIATFFIVAIHYAKSIGLIR
jgi:hypothetical protein